MADQGLAIAQFNVGLMYDKGQGVSKDEVQVMKWYRLAADQGRFRRPVAARALVLQAEQLCRGGEVVSSGRRPRPRRRAVQSRVDVRRRRRRSAGLCSSAQAVHPVGGAEP